VTNSYKDKQVSMERKIQGSIQDHKLIQDENYKWAPKRYLWVFNKSCINKQQVNTKYMY